MWRDQDTGAGAGNIYFSWLTNLVLVNFVAGSDALDKVDVFMQITVIIPAILVAVWPLVVALLAGDPVSLL